LFGNIDFEVEQSPVEYVYYLGSSDIFDPNIFEHDSFCLTQIKIIKNYYNI
jgi:hypothetical protein